MTTIWKYEIPIEDKFSIDMPKHAKVLSFQCQKGVPTIWCLVASDDKIEKKEFRLYGTGHDLIDKNRDALRNIYWDFVGTIQMFDGDLVYHLFEKHNNK